VDNPAGFPVHLKREHLRLKTCPIPPRKNGLAPHEVVGDITVKFQNANLGHATETRPLLVRTASMRACGVKSLSK